MRIYLAAQYRRRLELCGYRDELAARGHQVTSRWLAGPDQHGAAGTVLGTAGEQLIESGDPASGILQAACAAADIEDICAAEMLIAFTEDPALYQPGSARGGRHVELGIALGIHIFRLGPMAVAVVGPRENQFCWLPVIRHYGTWAGFLTEMDAEQAGVLP